MLCSMSRFCPRSLQTVSVETDPVPGSGVRLLRETARAENLSEKLIFGFDDSPDRRAGTENEAGEYPLALNEATRAVRTQVFPADC